MKRVFIYGSCVTRDAEPWFKDFNLELVGYIARHSLASAFNKANVEEFDLSPISSAFQRRMCESDISSGLIDAIDGAKPDIIIWDICDERLGVQEAPTGGYVTVSKHYEKEGMHSGPFGPILGMGKDQHFELWAQGLDDFLEALRERGLADQVYLNATPWAVRDEFGESHNDQEAKAQLFNDRSVRYVDLAANKGVRVVETSQADAISRTDGHRWGPAPFHYVDNTYQRMLENLTEAMS